MKEEQITIFENAQQNDVDAVARILVLTPGCINQQDPATLMTVLHWSGANRNLALGKLLFDQKEPKVDPWIRDRWGRLAVDLALETGNQTLIDLFHRHMFPEDYENDFDPLDPPKGVTPIITPKPGL
jgi:ankyrin repeat protein